MIILMTWVSLRSFFKPTQVRTGQIWDRFRTQDIGSKPRLYGTPIPGCVVVPWLYMIYKAYFIHKNVDLKVLRDGPYTAHPRHRLTYTWEHKMDLTLVRSIKQPGNWAGPKALPEPSQSLGVLVHIYSIGNVIPNCKLNSSICGTHQKFQS